MKTIIRRKFPEGCLQIFQHPLLQKIFISRGIQKAEEVDYSLQQLLSFSELAGITSAVSCLEQALLNQEKILIIGDYDVDGATSTALAIKILRKFGFLHVDYLIPNRFESGFGLSADIIQIALAKSPDLIITVDNGISSFDGVAAAKKHGIKVIITDHHLPSAVLPSADAIVNPNQPDCAFLSKNLAGVGVAFYLMLALRSRLREIDWFKCNNLTEPNLADYLDLVALGTIADLAPLDQNNRILVYQGLARIRTGRCSIGIKALLAAANRDYERVTVNDLAYIVAPKINAAGRLDDMSLGVESLLNDSLENSRKLAAHLNNLNNERREIESLMHRSAWKMIQTFKENNNLPLGLCIFDESWHQGVIGILAAKIKDKTSRPTIAFAKLNEVELKGSARSVSGLHIRDILESINTKHPELISKFGGHSMAAGLSIKVANYTDFCDIFAQEVAKNISADNLTQQIYTDGELATNFFTLDTAILLQQIGPFGHSFPEPVFDGIFDLLEQRIVGRNHLKLTLRIPETEQQIDGIYFNVDTDRWPNARCIKARAVYKLDINEYNGRKSLQLIIEYLEPNG